MLLVGTFLRRGRSLRLSISSLLLGFVFSLESLLDTVLLLTNVDGHNFSSFSFTFLQEFLETLILLGDSSIESFNLLSELHVSKLSFHDNVEVF